MSDHTQTAQIDIAPMPLTDMPHQGEQAVAVCWRLREATWARQLATAHIEPIALEIPVVGFRR
ncbi:Uncharacterised protein [Mycobacteroides abscessus subsp. massiliense]|nr:Uncharacterised protein [Mycobacteroides abscessus subsp. massiliense]